MTTVIIRNISIDPADDSTHETENVKEFLFNHFKHWPATAKLFQDIVSPDSEIPLATPDDVSKLESLKGTIYVVIFPEAVLLYLAAIVGIIALQFLGGSSKSNAAATPVQRQSPNNGLSERVNSNRLNGRIPDIYGTVRSTPDLLAQPYKKFEDSVEVEYAYFCVGRGAYVIEDVQDDKTRASKIDGMSVEVYGPNTSPNSGAVQLLIGDAITEPLQTAIKSNDVTGQTLDPPDYLTAGTHYTSPFVIDNVSKIYINMISNDIQADIDFTVRVRQVDESDVPFGSTYTVDLTLEGDPSISAAQTFIINPGMTGKVQVEIARTSAWIDNPQYVPTDPPSEDEWADKLKDNLQWTAMYAMRPVSQAHFGNVTTVYSRTVYNRTSTEIKSRKLNMLASRKVGIVNNDNTIGAAAASSRMLDILVAVCLDTHIGNRSIDELDIDNIRTTFLAAAVYFGSYKPLQFEYTFDDDNLSFEETVGIITEAAFCTAYRRGNVMKMTFEKALTGSSILFNHRNKLPGTETRTVNFGRQNDNDGIELEYVDQVDGSPMQYYIPYDQSAINPQKVKRLGVQNRLQAYMHAHRLWNKLRYQNTMVEFDATQEAMLLLPSERILVADNTRTNTFDGEIVSLVGSVLTLSQRVDLDPGHSYTIFLQNYNGTIVTKTVVQGSTPDRVVLENTTGLLLALDDDLYARTTYEIIENSSVRKRAFIVEEKEPKDNFVTTVRAVNYEDNYYQNDTDFINEIVDSAGNII